MLVARLHLTLCVPWTVAHQAPLSVGFSEVRVLEWVPFPSAGESSWPRDQAQFFCIADSFFTIGATQESQVINGSLLIQHDFISRSLPYYVCRDPISEDSEVLGGHEFWGTLFDPLGHICAMQSPLQWLLTHAPPHTGAFDEATTFPLGLGIKKDKERESLVVQWLRTLLPMQGTWSIPRLGRCHRPRAN